MFTGEWKADHDVAINGKADCNPKNGRRKIISRRLASPMCYQVDKAKLVEANAFEMVIARQFNRLGSRKTSASKTITDINVTVLEMHKAVK